MTGWMCRKREPDVTQRVISGRRYDFNLGQKKKTAASAKADRKVEFTIKIDGGGEISMKIEGEELSVHVCVCVCVLLSLPHLSSNRWTPEQCITEEHHTPGTHTHTHTHKDKNDHLILVHTSGEGSWINPPKTRIYCHENSPVSGLLVFLSTLPDCVDLALTSWW